MNGYETGEAEVEIELSAGGQVGFRPGEGLEIGGSYAGFFDAENALDMSLMGADVQLSYRNFSAKGEYMVHPQRDIYPRIPAMQWTIRNKMLAAFPGCWLCSSSS